MLLSPMVPQLPAPWPSMLWLWLWCRAAAPRLALALFVDTPTLDASAELWTTAVSPSLPPPLPPLPQSLSPTAPLLLPPRLLLRPYSEVSHASLGPGHAGRTPACRVCPVRGVCVRHAASALSVCALSAWSAAAWAAA